MGRIHPHTTSYKPLHQNLDGGLRKRVLTSEVFGTVETGGNEWQAGEQWRKTAVGVGLQL
jgi:hypothetical protein